MILRSAALAAAGVAAFWAAPFWEAAGPESWTTAQIEELLSDSPWARPAEVRFTGERGGSGLPGVGGSRGGGRPGGGSRLPGSTPWPGAGGGIGFPYRNDAFEAETTIVWMSALPVRQAMERIGVREELREAQTADYYVVLVDGLPPAMAHLADRPEVFRNSARIERKDGPAIRVARVDVEPRPGAPGIELYFPRDAGISAGDKHVEVIIATDDYVIRRKFKPAEMVYRGRLEM